MHIQNCSSKSLLMSLILHFSCQNFEICYLNVTSITSRWLLFSYQIYRVIIMGFFCLFASGHFVLHFHFLFFCLFLFFFFPQPLSLISSVLMGAGHHHWLLPSILEQIVWSCCEVPLLHPEGPLQCELYQHHWSVCLLAWNLHIRGAHSSKHSMHYSKPGNVCAPAGLVFIIICFHW